MLKKVSIFSNPKSVGNVVDQAVSRISIISQAFTKGELKKKDYPKAIHALNKSYEDLTSVEDQVAGEVNGLSVFSDAISSEEIMTVINNMAVAKTASKLCAKAIFGELEEGQVQDLDEALDVEVPEDDEVEVEDTEGDIEQEEDEVAVSENDDEGDDDLNEDEDVVETPDENDDKGDDVPNDEDVVETPDENDEEAEEDTPMVSEQSKASKVSAEALRKALFG